MASLDKSMLDALEIGRDSPLYLDAVTALQAANKELKDLMDAEDNIFFKPKDTTIQAARNKVMLAEGVLKAMEDKYTGSFTAEKEALSKKYTEMYGTEYTGGETKEDFNLKDQRTVGQ
jgi:phage terminase large subunit-like protein